MQFTDNMHLKTFIFCLVVQAIFCHDLNQNSLLPSTSDDWLNNNKKQQQNFVAASTRDADRTIFNPFFLKRKRQETAMTVDNKAAKKLNSAQSIINWLKVIISERNRKLY